MVSVVSISCPMTIQGTPVRVRVCVCVCVFKWAMINIYYFASKLFYSLMHQGHRSMSLSASPFLFFFHIMKAMAPHSSTLAWKIPWAEEPGGLQSMGSRRVGHDSATSLSLFTFMHWRRKWQPTPVFLPGESQGRGSMVGCCL